MELKDYIHYYIGADCTIEGDTDVWHISGIERLPFKTIVYAWTQDLHTSFDIDKVKPILRRIDGLTSKEKVEAYDVSHLSHELITDEIKIDIFNKWIYYKNFMTWTTHYLLSLHIDPFGLIDAGLAIDAATLINANK